MTSNADVGEFMDYKLNTVQPSTHKCLRVTLLVGTVVTLGGLLITLLVTLLHRTDTHLLVIGPILLTVGLFSLVISAVLLYCPMHSHSLYASVCSPQEFDDHTELSRDPDHIDGDYDDDDGAYNHNPATLEECCSSQFVHLCNNSQSSKRSVLFTAPAHWYCSQQLFGQHSQNKGAVTNKATCRSMPLMSQPEMHSQAQQSIDGSWPSDQVTSSGSVQCASAFPVLSSTTLRTDPPSPSLFSLPARQNDAQIFYVYGYPEGRFAKKTRPSNNDALLSASDPLILQPKKTHFHRPL